MAEAASPVAAATAAAPPPPSAPATPATQRRPPDHAKLPLTPWQEWVAFWRDTHRDVEMPRIMLLGLMIVAACFFLLLVVHGQNWPNTTPYLGSCATDDAAPTLTCRYYVGAAHVQYNVTWSQAAIVARGDCQSYVDADGSPRTRVYVATRSDDGPESVYGLTCDRMTAWFAHQQWHPGHYIAGALFIASLGGQVGLFLSVRSSRYSAWIAWQGRHLPASPPPHPTTAAPGGYNTLPSEASSE